MKFFNKKFTVKPAFKMLRNNSSNTEIKKPKINANFPGIKFDNIRKYVINKSDIISFDKKTGFIQTSNSKEAKHDIIIIFDVNATKEKNITRPAITTNIDNKILAETYGFCKLIENVDTYEYYLIIHKASGFADVVYSLGDKKTIEGFYYIRGKVVKEEEMAWYNRNNISMDSVLSDNQKTMKKLQLGY